jgi:cobyrinic acid a,c-diamide synthase
MAELGPRLVVAGTHSGVGKTTVATGLMAALRRRGTKVGGAKVGPDFIDPGYHALATGRPSRNLDAWICGPDAIPPLAGRAAAGVDLLVVEGVMGLFDGAADGTTSSTADVSRLLDAPVLLVVDASSMSDSVAAVVHGYATLDTDVSIVGVLLNRVGSAGHETLLREALAPLGIPVVGALHRDDALSWRDRHLGLVPVVEQRAQVEEALDRLAQTIEQSVDLDAVEAMARTAPRTSVSEPRLPVPVASARVAVAGGPAFSFEYPDNLEAMEAAGAELVPFDPLRDASLPHGCSGLIAGGGFPEVFAAQLASNLPLLADLRRRCDAGLVVWAECGGLLWLTRALDGHAMAGVIEADATMTDQLTLGYRTATTTTASPLGPAGLALRGHEFHYSTIEPPGDALALEGRFGTGPGGWATPTLLASYLHLHLGAAPELAEAFVRRAAAGA